MSLFYAAASQPEIIRCTQKDANYTDFLKNQLQTIIEKFTTTHHLIKYENLIKLLAEVLYHCYANVNGVQTLGEEYTGIMQVDSNYIGLPNKFVSTFCSIPIHLIN